MLKATEKALQASIKHWEVDGPVDECMGVEDCPLCARFQNDTDGTYDCTRYPHGRPIEKCPIFAKTGRRNCAKTPYNYRPTLRQVKAEIKFLKSLLPENAK